MAEIESYLEHLEWDYLQNKFSINNIIKNPNLPPNTERIDVWRDKSYNIKARLFATEKGDSNDDYFKESIPGKSIEPFTINGNPERELIDVELRYCHIEQYKSNWDERDGSDIKKIELDLSITEMKVNIINNSETAWLTDWYLNAPHNLHLPRFTERKTSLNFKRSRGSIEEVNLEYSNKSSSSGADFAFIDTNQVKFIIAKVNDDLGPEWSSKIGIEYIEKLGSIPKKETRESISEIVSFTLGKQLIHVGYTKYNSDGQMVEASVKSPWTKNTISLCQEPDYKPINIRISRPVELEEVLKHLVPSYFQLRNELNLNETLYSYWASIDSPIWINLPIISAALEGLMNKCFKSNKIKIRGVYMEKEEFNELLGEEITKISEKLDKKDFGDKKKYKGKILGSIQHSFQMKTADRFPYFFDHINLKIGEIENKTMNARHSMAHGGMKFDYETTEKMISTTFAYQTLFNRVFLKILGYDGYYIDRSTIGFPEHHLDVPLGGSKE